jgi:hypothetical protein
MCYRTAEWSASFLLAHGRVVSIVFASARQSGQHRDFGAAQPNITNQLPECPKASTQCTKQQQPARMSLSIEPLPLPLPVTPLQDGDLCFFDDATLHAVLGDDLLVDAYRAQDFKPAEPLLTESEKKSITENKLRTRGQRSAMVSRLEAVIASLYDVDFKLQQYHRICTLGGEKQGAYARAIDENSAQIREAELLRGALAQPLPYGVETRRVKRTRV